MHVSSTGSAAHPKSAVFHSAVRLTIGHLQAVVREGRKTPDVKTEPNRKIALDGIYVFPQARNEFCR